jgi:hypothetical protein
LNIKIEEKVIEFKHREPFMPVAEISYDLMIDEDMAFVEGSYWLPRRGPAGFDRLAARWGRASGGAAD